MPSGSARSAMPQAVSAAMHGVQLQFAHVHFVERVRRGVIIRQVVGLFLVGHERRHAFEHEIEIVGAEGSVVGVIVRAPGFQRLQHFAHARFDVAAATQRIPRDAADARVISDHRANFVEFGAVRLHVFERADGALFLAAEEHEANGAARQADRWP